MKDNSSKRHELYAYTCQLVSQLMYCSSKMEDEDFEKVTTEMLKLISKYEKKIKSFKE